MKPFSDLLLESAAAHGHLCPGQVVGIRMAMLGCRLIELIEPTRRDQIKKLIVFVEMDRCTADAVAHVTGVKLGRRSLKFMDYGIMAATFINLECFPRAFHRRVAQSGRYVCAGDRRQIGPAIDRLSPNARQRPFQGTKSSGQVGFLRPPWPDASQSGLQPMRSNST